MTARLNVTRLRRRFRLLIAVLRSTLRDRDDARRARDTAIEAVAAAERRTLAMLKEQHHARSPRQP